MIVVLVEDGLKIEHNEKMTDLIIIAMNDEKQRRRYQATALSHSKTATWKLEALPFPSPCSLLVAL